ncbi:MAG TPA: pyruvate kinase, partial [Desulfopila sp.]|nr:pyruvate kinase [Desulfopila sp.]
MANMRILLLEEHKSTQELLLHGLTKIGHSVEVVDNGHQGFLEATAKSYDVIISDISIPHWDGFKFIEAMEVVRPQLPIIVVTPASTDPSLVQRLHGYNSIVRVLSKPVDIDTIIETLAPLHSQKNSRLNKMARVVATIGPASSSEKIIGQMILAGMDVARLNFSHGSYTEHEKALTAVRKAEELWEKPVAVLVDLCGPKIRTGAMKNGSIELKAE